MGIINDLILRIPSMTIKEPKTICPKHGDTKGFNINVDGTSFCLYCMKEKMKEIGICEVVIKREDE